AVARRGCRGSLARCGAFSVLGDAATQCLHEIDHPMRRGKGLLALWNGAGLLGLQMRQQGLLVAVPEGRGVKLAGLRSRICSASVSMSGAMVRSGRSQK